MFYILNHFVNLENCDVKMSISNRKRVDLCVSLVNRKSFGHETWTPNIVMGNIFWKPLA